jgi:hypothetical protein
MRPLLTKPVMVVAIAFLAVGSVVQASIRHHHRHRHHNDRPHARFDILGRVQSPLAPGDMQPIEVALFNRFHHVLWISGLKVTVAIDAAHTAAGCSASRDFVVTQLPRSIYPIRLPARSPYSPSWPARMAWPGAQRWRLHDLGVPVLPTISMPNLADVDQDGCKGARLHLKFWASSRLHPPHVRVR